MVIVPAAIGIQHGINDPHRPAVHCIHFIFVILLVEIGTLVLPEPET